MLIDSTRRLKLGDGLPSRAAFDRAERDGWIASRTLQTSNGLWRIYNYSKECQYRRRWDEVTLIARGLIVDDATGEVVALPLPKFFNLGEQVSETTVAEALAEPFDALVKLDGSLGIGYRADGKLRWATRGSFSSDQSVVAQQMWEEFCTEQEQLHGRNPQDVFQNELEHVTPLAEIIHPETRVVVCYKFRGLVLLAAMNRYTGEELTYQELQKVAELTGMKLVQRIPSTDVAGLLARAKLLQEDEEGYVLCWRRPGQPTHRVKVKGEVYCRLHKRLSNITPRDLVTAWLDNDTDPFLVEVPEEHRLEYEAVFAGFDDQLMALLEATESVYVNAPRGGEQRVFAQWAGKQGKVRAAMFQRRQMEAPDYGRRLARITMAGLLLEGKLGALLQQMCAFDLAEACSSFESVVGTYLWDSTRRTLEGKMPIGRIVGLFPQGARSVVGATMEVLQPELIVTRLRQFIAEPAQRDTCGHLTVEEIFARAVPPEGRQDQHLTWVFSLPLPMRSLLDQWRQAGRKDTATRQARALLAASIEEGSTQQVEALLCEPLQGTPKVGPLLDSVINQVASAWSRVPLDRGPRVSMEWARRQPSGWPAALLRRAWEMYRSQVFKNFLDRNGSTEQPAKD